MIYFICLTQVLTVVGALIAVRWCIDYLRRQDDVTGQSMESMLRFLETTRVESDKTIKSILDNSFKERELLLERVQHPQYTQAQAAGNVKEPGSSVVDEETEAAEEFPDLDEDQERLDGILPVQSLETFEAMKNGS